MRQAFGSKSKQGMMVKLWRLPTVGYANDIETGEFEVDETVMGATDRLFERQADAQPWTLRIGHSAVYHFGARSLKGDGSKTLFDFYTGTVIWDGRYRTIDIAESETEPLLGLAILRGYRLQVD
jgi:hypothetical protein